MTAHLIVTAQVPEPDRTAFDHWYQTEHLRDAVSAFDIQHAQRGWSTTTAGTHVALYRFTDLAAAEHALASPAAAALIAEFDRVWQGRVTRTREIVRVAQTLP